MIIELNTNSNNVGNVHFVNEEDINSGLALGKYALHDGSIAKILLAINEGKVIHFKDDDNDFRPANIEVKYLRNRKIKLFERIAKFAKTNLEIYVSGVGSNSK